MKIPVPKTPLIDTWVRKQSHMRFYPKFAKRFPQV